MQSVNKQMTSRVHESISLCLGALWIIGGFISLYLLKIGYISNETQRSITAFYIVLWMFIDLCLGIYFKEFSSYLAVVRLNKNPKTYFLRITFNMTVITCVSYFLFRN
jgi:hypothetical protein